MTNLEVVFIYFAIGFMFTLIVGEIRRSYLDRDDILFGMACWPVIIITMIGWRVYQRIKLWNRRVDDGKTT